MRCVLFLYSLIFASNVFSEHWHVRREALEQVLERDHFRIFYTKSGYDALKGSFSKDKDGSGHPDFVEDILQRLQNADHCFSNDIGLLRPLENSRYHNKARTIDIHLIKLTQMRSGVAYDGVYSFNRKKTSNKNTHSIVIDLHNQLNMKQNTIEHELFHLYQNGYTSFKNRWFTEGTARWAENYVHGHVGKGLSVSVSQTNKSQLYKLKYSAKSFWNSIINESNQQDHGALYMRTLLENLAKRDSNYFKSHKLERSVWIGEEQKKVQNNYIWNAAMLTKDQLKNNPADFP